MPIDKDYSKSIEKHDTPSEKDDIVRAVCIDIYDKYTNKAVEALQIGKQYIVEYAVIHSSSTSIYLKETKDTMFSSSHFLFYVNGKQINLVDEVRPFVWIFTKDYLGKTRIITYKAATEKGLDYIRNNGYKYVPVIDLSKEIKIPSFPIVEKV